VELQNWHSSPIVIKLKRMGWAGYVAHVEVVTVHRISLGKPQVTGPIRRTRQRWEQNIKIDLWEICCEDVNWV
jgi:hypothetical protein